MKSSEEHYLTRIRTSRPDLVIRQAELNQEGFVNDILLINEKIIFRFGKKEWAATDLQQEHRCLQLARKYISLPLPHWSVYAPDFISYAFIPGEPLHWHTIWRLDQIACERLAAQLGHFLHQLHAIPVAEGREMGIGPSVTVRQPTDWMQLYADVQEELFTHLMPVARAWVHDHFAPFNTDPLWMDAPETFMNGDLAAYHLLFDPQTKLLNGIIDFGTAGWGDPACDFGCLINQYGERFLRLLAPHYPPGIAPLIERARFWAGTLQLQWLLQGFRDRENPSWFGVHIGRAQDVAPVGTGW